VVKVGIYSNETTHKTNITIFLLEEKQ